MNIFYSGVNDDGIPTLEWGTVGWDDQGDIYDLGDGSDGDSQVTLLRVTLFRGKDPTEPLDDSRAQGMKILTQLPSVDFGIPTRNTPVFLGIPGNDYPGAAVVLQVSDRRASQIFGQQKPGERCISGVGTKARVILKNNDSASLYTVDANGKAVSAYVGPDKIQLSNAFGAITLDQNGITLSAGQAAIILGVDGSTKVQGQTVSASASAVAISGKVVTSIGAAPNSKTLIGPAATPLTPAAYVNPAAPTVPSPSASVFTSPT